MKNIKKVTVIVLAALVLLAGGIVFGAKVGANSSWQSVVSLQAQREINTTGFDFVEDLKKKDLSEQMKMAIDPKIEEEQRELERLLNEYYRMKLAGLTDTPEFVKLEADIENLRRLAFERFKKDIDTIFVGK